MIRAARAAPFALCLALYWDALNTWFLQDDFAWLGLWELHASGHSWTEILFRPMAQGTIRPIGDRSFFLLFRYWFDLDALPYHWLVFATQFLNLFLLGKLAQRVSGSVAVGLLAPLIWISNSVHSWPLAWSAAFCHTLLSTVFLGAVLLLPSHWWAQVAVFLTGFGVLETNVVYPAIAAAAAPSRWRRILGLGAVSVGYTALHSYLSPKHSSGTYALDLLSLPSTLISYWQRAWWPSSIPGPAGVVLPAVIAIALGVFIGRYWRSAEVRLGVVWFVAGISVYLLLPNHISDYYLATPTIGLSLVAASALRFAWGHSRALRAVACLLAMIWVAPQWYAARKQCAGFRADSLEVEQVVLGAREIHGQEPDKAILLDGVSDKLFWNGIYDHPFRLIGLHESVFLTPDTAVAIAPAPQADPVDYSLPRTIVAHAVESGQAVVYSVGDPMRNITTAYRERIARWSAEPVSRIPIGNPLYAHLLGEGWHPVEPGYRWMGASATVRLSASGGRITVRGFCAAEQTAEKPLRFSVGDAPVQELDCRNPFLLTFPAQPSAGEIRLNVDRTFRASNDPRDLGVAIEEIAVLP